MRNIFSAFVVGAVFQTSMLVLTLSVPLIGAIFAAGVGIIATQVGVWCWLGSVAFGKDTSPHFQMAWAIVFAVISVTGNVNNANVPLVEILGICFVIALPVCAISGLLFRLNYSVKSDAVFLIPNRDYQGLAAMAEHGTSR
jgi:hypothetical protein